MTKHVPPNLQKVSIEKLTELLKDLEAHHRDEDVISITGPLFVGIDHRVRAAIEAMHDRNPGLLIVLDTPGGLIEVAERIVDTVRHHYARVRFLVPDRAMSAGTILAMSGDAILMDYFSCLGPIDPQVEKRGVGLVPALSYLEQFERLKQRAIDGKITTAEMVLLEKLDLAELHHFELQRDLSIQLIRDWLVRFKFRNWTETETHRTPVTDQMRAARAEEIARQLSDHKRWGSHGRGIPKAVLERELALKIDDFGADPEWTRRVRDYHGFLQELMVNGNIQNFVHSREFV